MSTGPAYQPLKITIPASRLKRYRPLVLGLILLLGALGLVLAFGRNLSLKKIVPGKPAPVAKPTEQLTRTNWNFFKSTDPIAKVGEELIYKKDVEAELIYNTGEISNEQIKTIQEKIMTDSIILQGSAQENLITLNENIFNSLTKDYGKRLETVEKAKSAVANKADYLTGAVIVLWFYTAQTAQSSFLPQAQKITLQKITDYHTQVKNGQKTIEQVAEAIRNDASLGKIDPAYKTNAIMNFRATPDQQITFDEGFSKILWSLKEGEVSEIYLAADDAFDSQAKVHAVYMFGQVSARELKGEAVSFSQWLTEQRKKYEIVYY